MSATLGHNLTPASATPSEYQPTSDEASLEAGIRAAAEAMHKASTPQGQRAAYSALTELHARRSPAMVAHLERQRGLRT